MTDVPRDEAGRWLPGKSPNPTGGPREVAIVRRAAQRHGLEMIEALVAIVRDKDAPHASRIAAAAHVLDRGFGKPEQNLDLRVHMQKLELLLQARTDAMSESDLAALADRWDAVMEQKAGTIELEATEIDTKTD